MPREWVTEQLRLSAFSNAPIPTTERDWQKITGQEEAENRTAIAGGKMFSGSFQGGTLSLAYSGLRADIILNATLKETAEEPQLPSFGRWSDTSVFFRDTVSKWLEQAAVPMVRLAFGAILLHQVDSRESAYKTEKREKVSTMVSTRSFVPVAN
jgi:hypothetical protein